MTKHLSLFAVSTALVVTPACSDSDTAMVSEDRHVAIVCVDGLAHCDRAAREQAFQQWIDDAVDRPGSTFSLWVAGATPTERRLQYAVSVPETWSGGVMKAKADFAAEARRGATTDGNEGPRGVVAPPKRGSVVLVDAGGAVDLTATDAGPAHTVVICDRSNSTLGISCGGDALASAVDEWARHGGREVGATWTLVVPGSSRDAAARALAYKVPDASPGERAAYVAGVKHEVTAWERTARRDAGSGIVEAIDVASEVLVQRRGGKWLVVLSDLRQYTPHVWNFEAAVPTPARFSAWLDHEQLRPELTGVAVRACGLHAQRGPKAGPFSAEAASRLRAVWQAVFTRSGVSSLELQAVCDAA